MTPWKAGMWAGLLACDVTGCGPFMISQPMICGPLFGWLQGNLLAGVVIGGIVQLLWLDVTPVGVGIPFDTMSVTILAVDWSRVLPAGPVGGSSGSFSPMILALMAAVPFGFVFRWMDSATRHLNTWAARKIEAVSDSRLRHALTLGILGGLAWSWLRYAVFYVLSLALGRDLLVLPVLAPALAWISRYLSSAPLLLPMAGIGVGLELFLSEEPERRLTAPRYTKRKT